MNDAKRISARLFLRQSLDPITHLVAPIIIHPVIGRVDFESNTFVPLLSICQLAEDSFP